MAQLKPPSVSWASRPSWVLRGDMALRLPAPLCQLLQLGGAVGCCPGREASEQRAARCAAATQGTGTPAPSPPPCLGPRRPEPDPLCMGTQAGPQASRSMPRASTATHAQTCRAHMQTLQHTHKHDKPVCRHTNTRANTPCPRADTPTHAKTGARVQAHQHTCKHAVPVCRHTNTHANTPCPCADTPKHTQTHHARVQGTGTRSDLCAWCRPGPRSQSSVVHPCPQKLGRSPTSRHSGSL